MMYGSECQAINKKEEIKMKVAVTRMLRWMCVVTRLDRISNECERGSLGIRNLVGEMREN